MHARSNALTRTAAVLLATAALLAAAALLLVGATAAPASTPAPTQRTAVAAGHVDAVIPPRIFPIRLVPIALRTPRVQRTVSRINAAWVRVKTYAREHPDEILERIEDLSDAIELALDAYDEDDPSTCTPVIEPICARFPLAHGPRRPAYGIVLAGPYAGTRVWLTCQGYVRGALVYYTPTVRKLFYARYVWTYWYPGAVPNMASCA
jgi:hypothetical protein